MNLYKITEQKLNYFKYSKNTINIYLFYVDEFELKLNKHYTRITAKDIQSYLDNYKFSSISQQNQIISALKFMWEKGLGKIGHNSVKTTEIYTHVSNNVLQNINQPI